MSETEQAVTLGPCPFCPQPTERYFAVREVGWLNDRERACRIVTVCSECGAQGPAFGFMSFNNQDTAAQYWNSRASVVAPQGDAYTWRSIETAPRNGAAIIVGRDGLVPQSVRWMVSVDKGAPDGAWFVGGYNGTKLSWEPTHWTDLPRFNAATPVTAPVSTGEQAERLRHHEMTPERWEELQAALDRPEGPTEAEAEEVLQHCGTGGREVVNQFIEHLLNENRRLSTALFDLGIELEKDGSVSVKQKKFHAAICDLAATSTTPDGERERRSEPTITVRAQWVVDNHDRQPDWACGKCCEGGDDTTVIDGFTCVYHRALVALAATTPPPAVTEAGEQEQSFQNRVQPWMIACFGAEIASDKAERNHRFLEEALELVQACGATRSEAHQLVDYTFGRPAGAAQQEVGGVMVTLAALCLAQGFNMHACGETELSRIWGKVETIRAKQAAKPKHSPLPEHVAPPSTSAAIRAAAEEIAHDRLGPRADAPAFWDKYVKHLTAILSRYFGKGETDSKIDLDPLEFWCDLAEVLGHPRPEQVNPVSLITEVEERLRVATPAAPSPGEPRLCLKCGHDDRTDLRGRCIAVYRDPGGSLVYCDCTCRFDTAALRTSVEGESE